jgi:hypothetical protein
VPSRRLAAGAGINSMIRQLGAVLGVALFVAVVGSPAPAAALTAFHHGWILAAIASSTAALAAIALRTGSSAPKLALELPTAPLAHARPDASTPRTQLP